MTDLGSGAIGSRRGTIEIRRPMDVVLLWPRRRRQAAISLSPCPRDRGQIGGQVDEAESDYKRLYRAERAFRRTGFAKICPAVVPEVGAPSPDDALASLVSCRVDSEVGTLRKLTVNRPGLEDTRLTPSNTEEAVDERDLGQAPPRRSTTCSVRSCATAASRSTRSRSCSRRHSPSQEARAWILDRVLDERQRGRISRTAAAQVGRERPADGRRRVPDRRRHEGGPRRGEG